MTAPPERSTYALLVEPSFNRVYTKAAPAILEAELAVVDRLVLGGVVVAVRRVERGGARFVELDTDQPLTPDDLVELVELSSVYVVFERRGDALVPVDAAPVQRFPDDLLTTLKYSGKTNEQFTKLLVNLALAASAAATERRAAGLPVRLLDPMAGRGTTLNQGLMLGFDVVGIEADRRDTDAYGQFLVTWLQEHRIKHRVRSWTYRKGRDTPAHELVVTIKAVGPEGHDQVVRVVHDDTLGARGHLAKGAVDIIVCDLPYGVQHGARTEAWGSSRAATELLAAALPVWRSVLRVGGAAALAFNRRTVAREELEGQLRAAGLVVLAGDPDAFVHRVDRSITRDVVVATRPG